LDGIRPVRAGNLAVRQRAGRRNKEGFFMKKSKLFILGILGVLLTCGAVLLGCSDGTTEETNTTGETDTWSAVTSLSQLNGTWKGSLNRTMTIKEWAESTGGIWNAEAQSLYGGMMVTDNTEATTTINAANKTQAFSMTRTISFSGGNIGTAWETMRSGFLGWSGFTIDDTKHSITRTQTQSPETLSDAEIAQTLANAKINQTGKKIKGPADQGLPEIIYIKQ
jgi:hypothetical protein